MRLFTSRYSNPKLRDGEVVPVVTSRGRPKWPLGYELLHEVEALMPRGWMFSLDRERFDREYVKHLERVGVRAIREALREIEDAHGLPVCLLCFEDVRKDDGTPESEHWCHRAVFARWWQDKTGWPVEELADPTPLSGSAKKDDGQGSLFD